MEILVPSKAYFPVDASLLEEAMVTGQGLSECGEVDVGGNERDPNVYGGVVHCLEFEDI